MADRTNITVAPETALAFRVVRAQMSEGAGASLSVDEVLKRLMDCWRDRNAEVSR